MCHRTTHLTLAEETRARDGINEEESQRMDKKFAWSYQNVPGFGCFLDCFVCVWSWVSFFRLVGLVSFLCSGFICLRVWGFFNENNLIFLRI